MKWNPKDKLYVNPYGWNSEPSRKDEVVYIRKDALLSWAEEEMMKAAKQSDAYGRRNAFIDVIDKINSL